ncbi:hypothetical protein sync_1603 [Synechococcus sp. CC9311]|nr:hypothetical protein sync_1603 [Synechococcus sp. CC9311]
MFLRCWLVGICKIAELNRMVAAFNGREPVSCAVDSLGWSDWSCRSSLQAQKRGEEFVVDQDGCL